MSTSDLEGRILVPSARLASAEDVSSRALRTLANNAHHYADQKCHHLVNWVSPASGVVPVGWTPYLVPSPVSTDFVLLSAFGPFPLTVHGDRSSYDLRLELLGATSSGGTAVTFAAVVVDDPERARRYVEDAADTPDAGVIFTATSSATPAWLAATTGAKQFQPSRSLVDRMWGARSTLLDTGGDPTTVDTCEAFLVVFAKTANVLATPRLYGVHLSEYVGT